MIEKIKPWIWDIISCSLPPDYDIEALRKILMLNIIAILDIIILVILGIIALFQNDYLLCFADLITLFILLYLLSYLRKTRNFNLVGTIGLVLFFVLFSFLIAYGGPGNTTFLWAFTYPPLALFLLNIRLGTLLSMLFLLVAGMIFAFGRTIPLFTIYSPHLVTRFIAVYCALYLFSFVIVIIYEMAKSRLKNLNLALEQSVEELEKANNEKETLILELKESMAEIKTLQGIIPMCANCKKIRDDRGYWEQVENYVQARSSAHFSHSICPECAKELYPEFVEDK